MYCPEQLVLETKYLSVWMYGSGDIRREYVPLTWWLNPLRYEFVIQPTLITPHMVINREGTWRIKASNFIFKMKQKVRGVQRRK